MKRILLTLAIAFFTLAAHAQLNNSWIDYSKTYYKFKVANDSLCRINQSALQALGLQNTPAEHFQLWRNGKQVRLYTSVATGPLGTGDFIEFWGQMNDGKPDLDLYRDQDYQLNDKYSLNTDTSSYFLTVNPVAANNLRYAQSANVISGTLTADAYFMRRMEENYKNQINRGYAAVIGEYVYSSSYDIGEGWTSNGIFTGFSLSKVFTDMNVYTAGPPNSLSVTVSAVGDALYTRDLVVRLFNTVVTPVPNPMPFFNYKKDTIRNLPISLLSNPSGLAVSVAGNSTNTNDRILVAALSVTFPATFNFNAQKNFYFELQPKATPSYLVINNFNNNGTAPILYDLTNGRRYFGDISTAGQVKFELPASTEPVRKFQLSSQDASNLLNIGAGAFTTRNFVNYGNTANQADYLIISNPVLYNNGSGVNNVDLYRQYRASAAGGNFNAKVYNIEELNDQFAFGIRNHPAALRDFIRYAGSSFSVAPKYTFIIGHGISYRDFNDHKNDPQVNQLDLVQTFGWPASDILLACPPGSNVPTIPIGRLGAVNGTEVGYYLDKMKQYEQLQASPVHTIAEKGWMKNILHTIGGADSAENAEFTIYMNGYKDIVEDTLYGGVVETFAKTSVAAVEQQQSQRIAQLFTTGLSYIKYFGHSSANELAINLNYPETYTNAGKYPFMHVSGCTVGNFFTYNVNRVGGYAGMSLSEKYLLQNQKGSIGFLGSSHYGIAPFLDVYNSELYKNFSLRMYGNTIGNQIKKTIEDLGSTPGLDYYTRIHLEEVNLHGDPALKLNYFEKPDYAIEDQLIKFTPNIISVADNNFTVDVKMVNLGMATGDSMRVLIRQKLPNDSIRVLYDQVRLSIKNADSVTLSVPINPITDKGLNKLLVSLDEGNRVNELSESNNTISKDFYIFEDELRPISPYNFSIVNTQNIPFYASTANPLNSMRQYTMELDTTENFNSAFKKTYNANGVGGVIQFNPGNISFTENTVYYWRTATIPTGTSPIIWNNSSFIYLSGGGTGFNQSHTYQHLKSTGVDLNYASDNQWRFKSYVSAVKIKNGVFPTAATQAQDFSVEIDGSNSIQSACGVGKIIINVFNPSGMTPMVNGILGGSYGSDSHSICPTVSRQWNFMFTLTNPASRAAAVAFLDIIPQGYYVTVRNISGTDPFTNTYAEDWKLDDGGGTNTLYHRLKNAGFVTVDSFNRPRAFNFIYKKGDNSFTPAFLLSEGLTDKIVLDVVCPALKAQGEITSPKLGPARAWSEFHWRGRNNLPPAGDSVAYRIIGVTAAGTETLLYTVDSTTKDFDISAIDATQYPYLKLSMYAQDKVLGTPYQLSYWRVNYTPLPEGAVAPNILFSMKDTVEQGEKIQFKLAFKNISPIAFDSLMKINFVITDRLNQPHPVSIPKGKKLIAGDTLVVSYEIDTRNFPGANTIFVDVNPDNDQLEEYHFNNVLYKDFFVKGDVYNPLLDVTFDGVHIFNRDIVSAKPHILVNLKDESRYLALEDTALLKVQVRYPDGSLHNYQFGDSMRFTPANLATGQNSATIDFLPHFPEDGEYELIVSGKDVMGNTAGKLDYHVVFNVISKSMISNLLNYPNPFTTSTAFVFTITGSEVPQNMRIQVLTITGKVVREITKDELGPIHIGNNMTEFKWDGTDMYGAKLANGVYLYRVLTNLNGKSLERYNGRSSRLDSNGQATTVTEGVGGTDKFFNKGYGKMVILR
jgi:hypothetical protein